MKTCRICKIEKEINGFSKKTASPDGYFHECKICIKEYMSKYRNENKDKIKETRKKYNIKNSDINKKYCSEYYQKNKEKQNKRILKYSNERRKKDKLYKLKVYLRNRTFDVLKSKNFKKNNNFHNYIGCTVENLVKHLESLFKNGMNWENQGMWHIDHIVPLSSAKNEEELFKLCHYTNLQPLWAKDNIIKGNKNG